MSMWWGHRKSAPLGADAHYFAPKTRSLQFTCMNATSNEQMQNQNLCLLFWINTVFMLKGSGPYKSLNLTFCENLWQGSALTFLHMKVYMIYYLIEKIR
jgi:hypothetical protein